MKLAGVVILYHPDKTLLLQNIRSYLSVLDMLYVIDNTALTDSLLAKELKSLGSNIKYIANQQNLGIGKALNKASGLAISDGYTWMLTMDQDSYFEESQLSAYNDQFIQLFSTRKDVAVIAPSYLDTTFSALKKNNEYIKVNAVITSGSIINLDIWKKLNGFDEKLFIDEVDHEYCYRANTHNFEVNQFQNIYFKHQLGKSKVAGYFGSIAKRSRIIHSPERVYFMVRNYLFIRKKYKAAMAAEFKKRDAEVLNFVKNNLFFSGNFIKNFKSIVNGFIDYKKGDFSAKI